MNKINKILLVLVVVLVIVILVIAGFYFWPKMSFQKSYYAVYLDTGDLYFGELSHFPSLTLSNVWYLQRDGQGNNQLAEFTKAPWGPKGTIKLNKDKIVWTAEISDASQLIPYLEKLLPETQIQSESQTSGVPDQNGTSTVPVK